MKKSSGLVGINTKNVVRYWLDKNHLGVWFENKRYFADRPDKEFISLVRITPPEVIRLEEDFWNEEYRTTVTVLFGDTGDRVGKLTVFARASDVLAALGLGAPQTEVSVLPSGGPVGLEAKS